LALSSKPWTKCLLGDMEELNIKGIKALEDISKKRELFRKRSSAYSLLRIEGRALSASSAIIELNGKQKASCTERCGEYSMCTNGKRKAECKEGYGGSAMCELGKRKAHCIEGCAPLCGSVPGHEENALHGAAWRATKALVKLRRGQYITQLTEVVLGSLILHLTKKPRGKHSRGTMIATLRGLAEVRDAIATGQIVNEKAASAATREAVERAVDGQPAGEEESVRVPSGERGWKRRSAAAAGDDTEGSSSETTERA